MVRLPDPFPALSPRQANGGGCPATWGQRIAHGRLLRADGSTVVDGNPVELTFKAPSGLDGIATAITDSQGAFASIRFRSGKWTCTAAKIEVNGLGQGPHRPDSE
jgi:hypothetical protein